jgi:hypothetical protein
MASPAVRSQGTLIKIGNGLTPETFTALPGIQSFSGPGGNGSEIPVTDMDSTGVEILMGLLDEGTVTLNLFLAPANATQKRLRTDRANATKRNFQIVYTDGVTDSFAAYVLNFTKSGGVDQAYQASVTLRVTGSISES